MPPKHVLAIDFGTSNSYYSLCPRDKRAAVAVEFGDGAKGLDTAILYRPTKPPLIGTSALAAIGDPDMDGCILRTHFKPEIAASDDAKGYAVDFLRAVLDLARKMRLDIAPDDRQVIFGVPSEAGKQYRDALADVARQAGYGQIKTMDEPLGALFYQIGKGAIPVQDAKRGVLVVDFGGGTCDFAFVLRGEVKHSWGDMRLGGRLLDDLFFQWFLDQNPQALEAFQQDCSEYFFHCYHCRETKELFSKTMTLDRSERVSKFLKGYGRFTDLTWDEFERRARAYSPSEAARRFQAAMGREEAITDDGQSRVDLLEWFERCLTKGLRDHNVDVADIHLVFLTGGSSQWPFVSDILEDRLYIGSEKIKLAAAPFAAISEGLAMWPSLKAELEEAKKKLEDGRSRFINEDLRPLIDKHVKTIIGDIAETIARELFDKQLIPIFKEFRKNGGSVALLKQQLKQAAVSFEPQLQGLVHGEMSKFARALACDARQKVDAWFESVGLVPPGSDVRLDSDEGLVVIEPDLDPIYGPIIKTVLGAIGGVIALLAAEIAGGAGIALIMSGPIGFVIGLILGAVVAVLIVKYGWKKAHEQAEHWRAPPWLLKGVLTDHKMTSVRERIVEQVGKTVGDALAAMRDELDKKVNEAVQKEIDALTVISVVK